VKVKIKELVSVTLKDTNVIVLVVVIAKSGQTEHLIPEQTGSSSIFGKHSNTIIMDFLASTAEQSSLDRLDLIDSYIKIFNAI